LHEAEATAKSILPPVEQAKRLAAHRAVDDFVRSGMAVGIGSGSPGVYGVERIAMLKDTEGLEVVCVPTSFQSRQLIVEGGLTLGDLSRNPALDVVIDGADEVDESLNAIKGGGGCQTQEKIVASCGKRFVIVADHRKQSAALGTAWKKGVPLEVIPDAYVPIMAKLSAMGARPHLRMATAKAGPVVTDNGNFVIDVDFGVIPDPRRLHAALIDIPGVVETGVFAGMACRAYFGQADGSVVTWESTSLPTSPPKVDSRPTSAAFSAPASGGCPYHKGA
jgi:ribose 5-phosphate isomerase A